MTHPPLSDENDATVRSGNAEPAIRGADAVSARAQQTDRATHFIARVDAHLPTLADDAARRAFLDRQVAGWERRFARFIASDGESEPLTVAADPPQAADFLLTITRLAARRTTLACTKGEAIMAEINMNNAPGSAILSLLVAADQRCPAIIGHAHLLYYAGWGRHPDNAAKTFARLKRDVDDLCQAVADVEAAIKETKSARPSAL